MLYEWVKALHVLSIIAWMAGLLYLPRLFVYHAGVSTGSETSETFKVMERRLLRGIMNPAMIASWIFGLWLMMLIEAWVFPWFHAKLLLVVLMTGAHMAAARWRRQFAEDANPHGARFYRLVNEVPAVLAVGIVVLAIVEPF